MDSSEWDVISTDAKPSLKVVEDVIEAIYLEAYKPFKEGRIRDLPRLDPTVGTLGYWWGEFDRLVEGGVK